MSKKNIKEQRENKKRNFSRQGKKNRSAGRRFELKVRKDLESKGYVVDKWTNTIEFTEEGGRIIPAKRKYNPFLRALSIGTGFPDFIAIKVEKRKRDIIGIEVKKNGYLSKEEKEKCRFYLEKNIFSKILIAKSVKNGRSTNIKYFDFREKYD